MDFGEYLRFMRFRFFGHERIFTQKEDSVFSVDYGMLKKEGVKLLIFDVDDTLTTNRGIIDAKVQAFLKKRSEEFRIAIFSNCGKRRNSQIEEMLKGIDFYICTSATKPGRQGFLDILKHFGIDKEKTAMIGDRLGTDIWGAYITGIKHRILVNDYPAEKDTRLNYILKHLRNFERGFI